MFLAAAGLSLVAFALTWLLREIPLKTTANAPDHSAGLRGARAEDSLEELERALSVLGQRDQRWENYSRLASRARVELDPPELWLLARLGEGSPKTERELVAKMKASAAQIDDTLNELVRRSLARRATTGVITLTSDGQQDYQRLVTARCAGLRELLAGWDPDEHPELKALIDRLGREFVNEMPTPAAVPA